MTLISHGLQYVNAFRLLMALLALLVLVMAFWIFERPLQRLYSKYSWRRWEKRTGYKRPS